MRKLRKKIGLIAVLAFYAACGIAWLWHSAFMFVNGLYPYEITVGIAVVIIIMASVFFSVPLCLIMAARVSIQNFKQKKQKENLGKECVNMTYKNGDRLRDIEVLGGIENPVYIDFELVRRQEISYIWTCSESGLNIYICEDHFTADGIEFNPGDMIACQQV